MSGTAKFSGRVMRVRFKHGASLTGPSRVRAGGRRPVHRVFSSVQNHIDFGEPRRSAEVYLGMVTYYGWERQPWLDPEISRMNLGPLQ